MKTTTSKAAAKKASRAMKSGEAMLIAMLSMCDENLKGSRGSERLRIQGEIDGIRARLREMGC